MNIQFFRTTYSVVILSLIAFIFSAHNSLAHHGSPSIFIRDYLMASEMLKRCPEIAEDPDLTARRNQIEAFGQILVISLAKRARHLSPDLTQSIAEGKVRDWFNRQARETSDHHLCNMATKQELLKVIAGFKRYEILRWLKHYGSRTDSDVTPVRLRNNRKLRTYALPEFQKIALKDIARAHSRGRCDQPSIYDVRLVRKKRTATGNQPAYVQDALNVIERWDFYCGGIQGRVEVTFARDNDSMLGTYSILDK